MTHTKDTRTEHTQDMPFIEYILLQTLLLVQYYAQRKDVVA